MTTYRRKTRLEVFQESVRDYLTIAKDVIPFVKIHKYLPFAILIQSGEHFNHIVNDSVYPIETMRHTIEEGETLCKRNNFTYKGPSTSKPPCQGCLAIARGLAVRDLKREIEAPRFIVEGTTDSGTWTRSAIASRDYYTKQEAIDAMHVAQRDSGRTYRVSKR